MSSPTRDKLLAALHSGELRRMAQRSTIAATARALGITSNAYRACARGIRESGTAFPSWDELSRTTLPVGGGRAWSDVDINLDSFEDVSTNSSAAVIENPGSSALAAGPALAAFDAEHAHREILPDGHHVLGHSTLIDVDGKIVAQWIKTAADKADRVSALLAAVSTIAAAYRGASDPAVEPETSDDDLLCVYPFGDPHIGMLAWDKEAGENFDLSIAERNHVAAVDRLVEGSPAASHGLVINVGDYLHADGQGNTTTSGTRVDVDGRWPKVLSVGIRIMRRCIDRALTKHRHVTVINARGNHDELSSVVIAVALAQFYEREPRVTIDTSPEMFHWYRFGLNLIGVHHGHKSQPEDLMGVMATDRQVDWGETIHRRFYCGHVHHKVVKEVPGVVVEYLRTLAPGDAWHRGEGYRAGRDMMADTFHRQHGHIDRRIIGIGRVAGYPERKALHDHGAAQ